MYRKITTFPLFFLTLVGLSWEQEGSLSQLWSPCTNHLPSILDDSPFFFFVRANQNKETFMTSFTNSSLSHQLTDRENQKKRKKRLKIKLLFRDLEKPKIEVDQPDHKDRKNILFKRWEGNSSLSFWRFKILILFSTWWNSVPKPRTWNRMFDDWSWIRWTKTFPSQNPLSQAHLADPSQLQQAQEPNARCWWNPIHREGCTSSPNRANNWQSLHSPWWSLSRLFSFLFGETRTKDTTSLDSPGRGSLNLWYRTNHHALAHAQKEFICTSCW